MERLFRPLAIVLLLSLVALPGLGWSQQAAAIPAVSEIVDLEDAWEHLPNFDVRAASPFVAPSSTQKQRAASLGARASWNRFGTPHSLIRYGGYLGSATGNDVAAGARSWVRANRSLFKLSDQAVSNLELVSNINLGPTSAEQIGAHVVIFRQKFGNWRMAEDGLITLGISQGKVAYVSSSAFGDAAAPESATVTPRAAWLTAATNANFSVAATSISNIRSEGEWSVFDVAGFAQPQRARLRAFAGLENGQVKLRPIWETNVVHSAGGEATAYRVFVDAQTNKVLFRYNAVQHFADDEHDATLVSKGAASSPLLAGALPFSGQYEIGPYACGPEHPFTVDPGTTSIKVFATADIPTNDIVLFLLKDGVAVASQDTGASPEAILYAPGVELSGEYAAQVCPYTSPPAPHVEPTTYQGTAEWDEAPLDTGTSYNPKWKYFPSDPPLDHRSLDTRTLGCWYQRDPAAECTYTENGVTETGTEHLGNFAARGPWDWTTAFSQDTDRSSNTTLGNAANSGEAWESPLTPDATRRQPVSPEREYVYRWTNAWYEADCNPAALVGPTNNDIDAAVTNLFVAHNRMHDWSWKLKFREEAFNAQVDNFGRYGPTGQADDKDPEIGNAQAGALEPAAVGLSRDNANQITLQDGVAPITNMYLWQPIAAAFYAPCVDGDYDMAVIGHEYSHLISNRMVAGPDSGLSGLQARALGESWSDLIAMEYLQEHNYYPINGGVRDPSSLKPSEYDAYAFATGAYVTGNAYRGIRNYNMSQNPLNYSDVGYDPQDQEFHANGEIWTGTNFDIRQALINKYNAEAPVLNRNLQEICKDGLTRQNKFYCPGNRRWAAIVFTAFLLMQSDVSMLDARDAYLAADKMIFQRANQVELWRAFARRGMGESAHSSTNADVDPIPSFASAAESNEARITFQPVDGSTGATIPRARIYIGDYEARVTPVADTTSSTSTPNQAHFVPGTYSIVVAAPGYGHRRFRATFSANQNASLTLVMHKNLASKSNGATVTGSGDDANIQMLIDDTEATNWAHLGSQPVNQSQPYAIVNLGGGAQTVARIQVSALNRFGEDDPPLDDPSPDPGGQSRFAQLRQFQILVCNTAAGDSCSDSASFRVIYTSPENAFPSRPPRPVAPDMLIKSFDLRDTVATHVMLRVLDNQCTGNSAFHIDDADPSNNADCRSTTEDERVRTAELQVFSQ